MKKKKEPDDCIYAALQTEDVKERIFCRTIPSSGLPPVPGNIPFERHQDLAVIYYIEQNDPEGLKTLPLCNSLVTKMGLKTDQMRELAWKNTITRKRAVLQPLAMVLGQEEEDAPPLYVLTNEDMFLGAVTMLYPGLLEMIAEKFESDLCILPSSIHECLLMPADSSTDWAALRKIVQKVNDTEVDEEDILSYNIYRYSRADKQLSIDNT